MKKLFAVLIVFAVNASFVSPAHSEGFAGFNLGLLGTDQDGADLEFAFGARAGKFINENVSLGGVIDYLSYDYGIASVSLTPILFSANYHFTGSEGAYAAGRAGFVRMRAEVDFFGATAAVTETELAIGAAFGFMAPITPEWALGVEGNISNVFADESFLLYGIMGSVNYLF